MLHLALSVSKSSAFCERTFSEIHCINTDIRSIMLLNRFSKFSIVSIERGFSNVYIKKIF